MGLYPYERPCVVCGEPFVVKKKGRTRHQRCVNGAPMFAVASDPRVHEASSRAPQPIRGRHFDDERNSKKWPNPVRTAVVDIECTSLEASHGRVLCGVAYYSDEDEPRVWRLDDYEPWKKGLRADDSMVVQDILAGLEDADIVIAHNGLNYDFPFLRTRALVYDMPPVHPRKIIDPLQLARKHFRFKRNSLDELSSMLGVPLSKTRVDGRYWTEAMGNGSKEAMDYIVEHCVIDVAVLNEVAWRMRKYVRTIDAIGSWR